MKDLKVLGMKDLRMLKKWRDALRKEFEALDEEAKKESGEGAEIPAILVKTQEELEDEELQEMDKKIAELKVLNSLINMSSQGRNSYIVGVTGLLRLKVNSAVSLLRKRFFFVSKLSQTLCSTKLRTQTNNLPLPVTSS